jgi:hypothetical protein
MQGHLTVTEGRGYPLVIYINSLGLLVCDGWARAGHGLNTDTNWTRD